MAPSRGSVPPQRWNGLLSASLDALKDDAAPSVPEAAPNDAADDVEDLISKAALAVDGHATAAQLSRTRMARLSSDAAASLRSAIIGETPTVPGMPRRGVTSGTRLDVQR